MEPPLYRLEWLEMAGNGRTDTSGVQWILMEEQGFWDAPDVRRTVIERSGAHGAYIGPIYKQQRVITLRGRMYCRDAVRIRRAWSQVTGLGADPTASLTLSCDSRIGTQQATVRLDSTIETKPLAFLNTHAVEFAMTLVAPDPRKYSADTRTMRADLPQAISGTGLDFAGTAEMAPNGQDTTNGLAFPLNFGGSNASGWLQLANNGTAPTCPVYRLYGPLVAPVLTASTGGDTALMQYNSTLESGQYIEIDPSGPFVALQGTASRRHLLNPADFSGFYIPAAGLDQPGMLAVGLTHSGATTTGGYATATFRDAWF